MQQREGFTAGWMVALASAYRTVHLPAGGYVTAALAPRSPGRHAVALGLVGAVLTVVGAVAVPGVTPAWFSAVLILEAVPCTWEGMRLRHRVRVAVGNAAGLG